MWKEPGSLVRPQLTGDLWDFTSIIYLTLKVLSMICRVGERAMENSAFSHADARLQVKIHVCTTHLGTPASLCNNRYLQSAPYQQASDP